MEFCETNLLKDIEIRREYQNKSYEEDELWLITVSCLSALHYLKNYEIYHEDIQPEHILIDRKGQIKILSNKILTTRKNYLYMLLGTPGEKCYLAPEQLEYMKKSNFSRPSHKGVQKPQYSIILADIYSLGVCILQAALLRLNMDHLYYLNVYELNEFNLQQNLDIVKNQYSEHFCQFIQKLMRFDPSQRLGTDQALEEIKNLEENQKINIAQNLYSLKNVLDDPKNLLIYEKQFEIYGKEKLTPYQIYQQRLLQTRQDYQKEVQLKLKKDEEEKKLKSQHQSFNNMSQSQNSKSKGEFQQNLKEEENEEDDEEEEEEQKINLNKQKQNQNLNQNYNLNNVNTQENLKEDPYSLQKLSKNLFNDKNQQILQTSPYLNELQKQEKQEKLEPSISFNKTGTVNNTQQIKLYDFEEISSIKPKMQSNQQLPENQITPKNSQMQDIHQNDFPQNQQKNEKDEEKQQQDKKEEKKENLSEQKQQDQQQNKFKLNLENVGNYSQNQQQNEINYQQVDQYQQNKQNNQFLSPSQQQTQLNQNSIQQSNLNQNSFQQQNNSMESFQAQLQNQPQKVLQQQKYQQLQQQIIQNQQLTENQKQFQLRQLQMQFKLQSDLVQQPFTNFQIQNNNPLYKKIDYEEVDFQKLNNNINNILNNEERYQIPNITDLQQKYKDKLKNSGKNIHKRTVQLFD
ncbi:Protein kinase-like domain [Pseudocohnilembus persalinus]|uniref:non-specific serine/threonine protein kinase n=1 Tax=Pseudocohnilembus persalinus TaxID=266149 RepID=A0A0V0R4X5_PSEPJ|nr:Protein kinase-like domain [Pseudocohnilembus persalinus]|eukprot:KRX09534.1 Protein kinase-like domain [Pseudocohnilembus persalinus]